MFSQRKFKVNEKSRVIAYHVLSYEENGGFFKKNQELPSVLLDAAFNNQIAIYQIDYNTGIEEQITTEALKIFFRKFNDPKGPITYGPEEVSLIGIDVTKGYQDDQVYYQYNYLNLYMPYYNSATTTNIYIGSFRYDEALDLLDDKNVLWYSEGYGLTNTIFTNYEGFSLEETTLAKNLLEDIKNGYLDASFGESINISMYNAYDGYPVEVHLRERKEGAFFIPVAIELHKANVKSGEGSFICSVPWEEMRQYIKSQVKYSISFMSDALLKRILTSPSETWRNRYENFYDSNFTDWEVIAENGKFIESNQVDILSAGNKIEPQKAGNIEIGHRKLMIHQVEFLNPELSENEGFLKSSYEITRIFIDEALKGNLNVYTNDSLLTEMGANEFKAHVAQLRASNISISSAESPYLFDLVYRVMFNYQGEKKSYEPVGLGVINAKENHRPIGFFKVNSLMKCLSARSEYDSRLGKQYFEMLLNRDFKSYLRRSSHISIRQKP